MRKLYSFLHRTALLFAAGCLLCACAAGYGGPQDLSQIPGEDPEDEITCLDWYINFSWFTTTWDDSLVAKTVTEETGVKINFITPTGNEWEKLTAMMASDTLPDLVTLGYWEPQVDQMIAGGQVHALSALADEFDPYFWEVAHPQRVAWYTKQDGNLYAYPNSSYAPDDYETHSDIGSNQAFLVRRDIYEGLGSPDMSTPAGFRQAVRDAAAQYTSLDGQPLIPIGLHDFDKDGCYSLEAMLMNLLAVPFERDGQFYDRFLSEDYIEWLKVLRSLHEEGYFPDDVFVDRRVQVAERVSQGRYFCMIYQHTDIADQQLLLYSQHPGSEYIAVDGPKNAAGDDHTLPGVGIYGWTVTMIAKNSKVPDKAIRFMSYLMSEHGQKRTYLGVEGVTYDTVDGKPVIRPAVRELLSRDRAEYNRLYAADNTYWMLQDSAMQLDWQPPGQQPLRQPREWTFPYTFYGGLYETTFVGGTREAAANQSIREEWGRTLPKLLTASSDEEFDLLYAAFLKKREELGNALVMREAQRQMMEAKEKLRILS